VIGVLILGSLLSLIGYFAVRGLWRVIAILEWRKRRHRLANLTRK
jgi:uncharacterized protein (DUF2062 family)